MRWKVFRSILYRNSVVLLLILFSSTIFIYAAVTEGIITTVAGTTSGFAGDNGQAIAAQLAWPTDVVVDEIGNLYIADPNNQRIRKIIAATGVITTVAGSGSAGIGNGGFSGDSGLAIDAQLDYPVRIALDDTGNLYIADANNHRIRKVIAATGIITTVVGSGPTGALNGGFSGDNGPATEARLNFPADIAIDGFDNLYIADQGNHRIRKVEQVEDHRRIFLPILLKD